MAEEKKKSRVDDINRSVYDIKDEVEFSYKADRGLTEDIIRKISTEKEEPAWMLGKRLQALRIYESLDVPPWRPIFLSSIWITSTHISVRKRT